MLLTEEQKANFPVGHYSASAIKTYLEDRQGFFKRNIRFEFDQYTKPVFVIGRILHHSLEDYYKFIKNNGKPSEFDWEKVKEICFLKETNTTRNDDLIANNERDLADFVEVFKIPEDSDVRSEKSYELFKKGLALYEERITNPRYEIANELVKLDWFKHGKSPEGLCSYYQEKKTEIIKEDMKTEIRFNTTVADVSEIKRISFDVIDFYREELPKDIKKVLDVEERYFTQFTDLEGNEMPIPLKAYVDLVWEDEDDLLVIEDHKTVGKPSEAGNPGYEIQACTYWFVVRAKFGKNPDRMIFRQILKTKQACPLKKDELIQLLEKNKRPVTKITFEETEESKLLEKDYEIALTGLETSEKLVSMASEMKAADIKLLSKEINEENYSNPIIKHLENYFDEEVKGYDGDDISDMIKLIKKCKVKRKSMLVEEMTRSAINYGLWTPDPQVVPYVIKFDTAMIERFLEIYRRVTKELSGQPLVSEDGIVQFLPNPFGMFNGKDSWQDFCDEVEAGPYNINDIISERDNRYENIEAIDLDSDDF